MTSTISIAKNVIASICIAVLFFVAFAQYANAQTYFYPTVQTYGTTSSSVHIQQLLNQLYALIAQVQALQSGSSYTYKTTPVYTHTKVRGYDSKDYDVEVETLDADVEGDEEATFFGEVELDDAPYAHVWFEYGNDGSLTDETDDIRVTDDEEFDIDVDDLDDDERYYFRAVAEDPSGYRVYGEIQAFTVGDDDDDDDDDDRDDDDDNDEDAPEADTFDAEDIDENSAELHGEISMNDFEDGLAFFAYGEDEDAVEEVEDEDMFGDIDEDGDDLQVILLNSSFDDTRTFWATVSGLNEDTEHFFRICVEYEDEDEDETLECGDVESFQTDQD